MSTNFKYGNKIVLFDFFPFFHTVLPTNSSVPIENVVVAESGDDSEDEWNYIKVADKEKPDQERELPVELESEHDEKESLKEVVAADNDDDQEAAVIAAASAAVQEDAFITSPTPPTASLGETDFINQQSHAIAQALAEPEEACSEVRINCFTFVFAFHLWTNFLFN